jgi:hypothetical protein
MVPRSSSVPRGGGLDRGGFGEVAPVGKRRSTLSKKQAKAASDRLYSSAMKWHDKRKGWVEDAKSGKAKEEHSHHPQINRQAPAAAHVFERSESLVNHVNTGERLYVS